MILPNYDEWKTASPPSLEIDAELERLEFECGQVCEVERESPEAFNLYIRRAITAAQVVEIARIVRGGA